MNYELILWDFDGTIADTGMDVWRSLQYAALRLGSELPKAYMNDSRNLGETVPEIFRHLQPFPGKTFQTRFDNDVRVHYRTMNDFTDTEMYRGMRPLLETLGKQGICNAIVTNKPRAALERILRMKNWSLLFDDSIASDDSDDGVLTKSQMMSTMLNRHHCNRKSCIAVGDTAGDIQAAHNNDLNCLAVTYGDGDTAELLAQAPTYQANDVDALAAILLKGQ